MHSFACSQLAHKGTHFFFFRTYLPCKLQPTCRGEDNLQDCAISFHYGSPGDHTRHCHCMTLWSHLTGTRLKHPVFPNYLQSIINQILFLTNCQLSHPKTSPRKDLRKLTGMS